MIGEIFERFSRLICSFEHDIVYTKILYYRKYYIGIDSRNSILFNTLLQNKCLRTYFLAVPIFGLGRIWFHRIIQ